jgi:hypothetical protein
MAKLFEDNHMFFLTLLLELYRYYKVYINQRDKFIGNFSISTVKLIEQIKAAAARII